VVVPPSIPPLPPHRKSIHYEAIDSPSLATSSSSSTSSAPIVSFRPPPPPPRPPRSILPSSLSQLPITPPHTPPRSPAFSSPPWSPSNLFIASAPTTTTTTTTITSSYSQVNQQIRALFSSGEGGTDTASVASLSPIAVPISKIASRRIVTNTPADKSLFDAYKDAAGSISLHRTRQLCYDLGVALQLDQVAQSASPYASLTNGSLIYQDFTVWLRHFCDQHDIR